MIDVLAKTRQKISAGAYNLTDAQRAEISRLKAINKTDGRIYGHSLQSELRDRFKKDALGEIGLADHPKADRLFELAWEYGHSAGWEEVLQYLDEIGALLIDK